MNDVAWLAYLDMVPPQHRALAQHIMERIQFVLNSDRNRMLDELQRVERWLELIQREIVALNTRMDEMDGSRSRSVGD